MLSSIIVLHAAGLIFFFEHFNSFRSVIVDSLSIYHRLISIQSTSITSAESQHDNWLLCASKHQFVYRINVYWISTTSSTSQLCIQQLILWPDTGETKLQEVILSSHRHDKEPVISRCKTRLECECNEKVHCATCLFFESREKMLSLVKSREIGLYRRSHVCLLRLFWLLLKTSQ